MQRQRPLTKWTWEGLGMLGLVTLLVFFLKTSWRKWPDPIVDFGQQCYSFWRISQGASIYHDFIWNYGPLSACFNACLFRWLGPGIMVVATANLFIYGGIVALAYAAFRRAWGWMGAFTALGVFISVFSFSHFLAVGNYNYVTPYSAETTHGMLLMLVTVFVASRWYAGASSGWALALGFCGGLSVVIKPEFMLATGVVGLTAYALRWAQRQRVTILEHALILAGLVLPTVGFAMWFARTESWRSAFIDASNAWWVVVVEQIQKGSDQQQVFSGFKHPLGNALTEFKSACGALGVIGVAWAAGWFRNRNWTKTIRTVTMLAAIALAGLFCKRIDWLDVGRCLPGLLLVVLGLVIRRGLEELRKTGRVESRTTMALFLVMAGGTMLARMALFPRIFHLGFFQGALAAMVISAYMVTEMPRWTGTGVWGGRVAVITALGVLAFGCSILATKSLRIRADQIQPVGSGRDRFYSTKREIDGMGVLVDWASTQMQSTPTDATLLVLPAGTMINYLSRRKSLEPSWGRSPEEEPFFRAIREHPPDYVLLLTLDLTEFGITRYGTEGNLGHDIVLWIGDNYSIIHHMGGNPLALNDYPGAIILRRKQH